MENGNRSMTFPRVSYDGRNGSRPVSFYDNFRANNFGGTPVGTLDKLKSKSVQNNSPTLRRHSPSPERFPNQLICLKTTVPQNIAAANIGERHTPTRNSLRRSRMIVVSNMGREVPKKSFPSILRSHKLAKCLLAFQIILGMSLCAMALWMLVWSPSLRTRDNPYWSGIPLLLSGIVGLTLLCGCRKEYPGMSKSYCTYSLKVSSLLLSSLASVACFTASAFALLHIACLSAMKCESVPTTDLIDSCMCKVDDQREHIMMPIKNYHYTDLRCPEVEQVLIFLLIFSCAANFLGGATSLWYIYLHWSGRYAYTYSKVRTKENQPTVISNV